MIIFSIILIIIYFLLVTPIGLIMKIKNKRVNCNTTFTNVNRKETNSNKKGIYNILLIFRIFANEKCALMLPLIAILIILGLLFIFVQSSIISPFIYTLF